MRKILEDKYNADEKASPALEVSSLAKLPQTLFYHSNVKTRYDELHDGLLVAPVGSNQYQLCVAASCTVIVNCSNSNYFTSPLVGEVGARRAPGEG